MSSAEMWDKNKLFLIFITSVNINEFLICSTFCTFSCSGNSHISLLLQINYRFIIGPVAETAFSPTSSKLLISYSFYEVLVVFSSQYFTSSLSEIKLESSLLQRRFLPSLNKPSFRKAIDANLIS